MHIPLTQWSWILSSWLAFCKVMCFWYIIMYDRFFFSWIFFEAKDDIIFSTLWSENYVPVNAKWTSERCAICRWVEDWEYNKIIICNRFLDICSFLFWLCFWFIPSKWSFLFHHFRCQIAVHQECYGARNLQDFASWVCRTCESPEIERECCLCPIKGKPFNTF